MPSIPHPRAKRSLLRVGLSVTAGLALLPVGALAQAPGVAGSFAKDVDAQIARHYASVEGLYKDIHASPEMAFEEAKTAGKLAKALRDLGFEVTDLPGTGCPMPARSRPPTSARSPSSPTAAGTTCTWRAGSAPPRRWWA